MANNYQPRVEIPKLRGQSNYIVWKRSIKAVFQFYKVNSLIEGTIHIPQQGTAEYNEYEDKHRLAKMIIFASISEGLLHIIPENQDNSRTVWLSITNKFERHVAMNAITAKNNFTEMKMQKGEGLQEFFRRIEEGAAEAIAAGNTITDHDKVNVILEGLTHQYLHLADYLGSDENVDLARVQNILLSKEAKLNRFKNRANGSRQNNSEYALKANSSQGFQRSKKPKDKRDGCWSCGKPGHI